MTDLTYSRSGDYYIPDLTLPEQPKPIYGKYGRMRKRYLKEHRGSLYNRLLLDGTLTAHLNSVDAEAMALLNCIVSRAAKKQGVTEELKARDQMQWVGAMNAIHAQAEEFILSEIVYQ